MENKWLNIGKDRIMAGYVKTNDIFKDMCGIIESSQKAAYQAINTTLVRRNWLLGYRIASEEMQHELRKLVLARGAEIEQLILTQKPIDPIIFEDEPENPDDPFDALHPFADGFALACSNWPELMKNTSKAVQAALVGVLRYESPDENTPDDEQEVAASIEEDMAFADLDEALADLTACVQEIAEVTRAEDIERMQSTTKKAAARKPPRRR